MNELEREAVRLTAMLSASEQWSDYYNKTPEQHAQLLKGEANMQVSLIRLFRNMQKKAGDYINWGQYSYQSQLDYNVDVIVNEQQIDGETGIAMKITLNPITQMVQAGIVASEIMSDVPLGIPSTSALIQKLGVKQVAALVGRKVLEDGTIVKNPNADYNIMYTVRKDIAQSVKTSLGLGETTDEAIARVQSVINPIERATLIAQTESVNAYVAGVNQFGILSNAVGEQWLDAGAHDKCREYAARGPQKFGTGWDGLDGPTAHPRCKCAKRLIYQEEWDAIQSGNPFKVQDGITPKPANYVPWAQRG